MSQEPAEIKAHIKAQGESLKDNLEEIETRVKNALDWRHWYRNNTAVALGGVAAGGLLLSLILRKPSSGLQGMDGQYFEMDDMMAGPTTEPDGRANLRTEPQSESRFRQVADNTMTAIFGLAADKFQDFMSKALPGFREHYTDAQRRRFE